LTGRKLASVFSDFCFVLWDGHPSVFVTHPSAEALAAFSAADFLPPPPGHDPLTPIGDETLTPVGVNLPPGSGDDPAPGTFEGGREGGQTLLAEDRHTRTTASWPAEAKKAPSGKGGGGEGHQDTYACTAH
jgi:hypothetical protein